MVQLATRGQFLIKLYKAKAGLDTIVFPGRLQNLVAVRSISGKENGFALGQHQKQQITKAPEIHQVSMRHKSKESQICLLTIRLKLKTKRTFLMETATHKRAVIFSPNLKKSYTKMSISIWILWSWSVSPLAWPGRELQAVQSMQFGVIYAIKWPSGKVH